MNYINLKTKQLVTPKVVSITHGINEYDRETALKLGYGVVEYDSYPEYDAKFYKVQPKPELTKVDDTQFRQEFEIVDRPIEEVRPVIKDEITAKRWDVETGGITLPDGTKVLTGIEDQNRIDSTISRMKDANIDKVKFKASTGWVELSQEQVQAIGVAIALHVEACFANECALHEAVDKAKSVKELVELDINAGWPGVVAE